MATLIPSGSKTKAVIRKQGYPTKCKTFTKRSDALVWAKKTESEMERGLYIDNTKAKFVTLETLLDQYYQYCHSKQLKALKFIKAHSRIIKRHLGQLKLVDINSYQLAHYRDKRLETMSAATVKIELGIVTRTIKLAITEWGYRLNEMPSIELPKVNNARHRLNTLIDGQPICEVDYNANHLRIVLALNAKEYAGDTPYEDICHEANVASRDIVKLFITVAMGASDEISGRKALHKKGFNNEFINQIYNGVKKRYPKLELFNGWGIFAQNFEGQILKDVLLEGIKEDIVCLPVHDAVAVQQQHQDWAMGVMLETWQRHMDGVKTKVKADMP
jgi:hypothetical protein